VTIKRPRNRAKVTVNENWEVHYDDQESGEKFVITPDEYDIIIGAEGGRSIVRDILLNDARDPETGEEMFAHYLTDNNTIARSPNYDELWRNNRIRNIEGIVKTSYVVDKFGKDERGDSIFDKYTIGYGIVGDFEVDKFTSLHRQKMETVLDQNRFIDANLRIHDEQIERDEIYSSVPSLIKPDQANFNLATRKTGVPTNTITGVDNTSLAPQHRYRFFSSPESPWYFGLSFSQFEYDSLIASYIGMKPSSEDKWGLVTIRNYKGSEIGHNKELFLAIASLLKYYNIAGTKEDAERIISHPKTRISAFPIALYKTSFVSSTKVINGKTKVCAIVGDASIGVHFFSGSGVNAGIKNAYNLVNKLVEFTNNSKDKDIYKDARDMCIDFNRDTHALYDRILQSSTSVSLDHRSIENAVPAQNRNNLKCTTEQLRNAEDFDLTRCVKQQVFIDYLSAFEGVQPYMPKSHLVGQEITNYDISREINKVFFSNLNFGN